MEKYPICLIEAAEVLIPPYEKYYSVCVFHFQAELN